MVRQEICRVQIGNTERCHNEALRLYIKVADKGKEKLIGPFEDMDEFLSENEKTDTNCFKNYLMVYYCEVCKINSEKIGGKFLSKNEIAWYDGGRELKKIHMII